MAVLYLYLYAFLLNTICLIVTIEYTYGKLSKGNIMRQRSVDWRSNGIQYAVYFLAPLAPSCFMTAIYAFAGIGNLIASWFVLVTCLPETSNSRMLGARPDR